MLSERRPGITAFLAVLFMLLVRQAPCRAADEEECFRCHGRPGLVSGTGESARELGISPESFESSVHSLLNCRECHSDISAIPHSEGSDEVGCGQACHQRDQAGDIYSHESLFWEYTTSVHGRAGDSRVSCLACHPAASLAKIGRRDLAAESDQCASCHRGNRHVTGFFEGIHYLALSKGDRRAPSCPDCHTSHRVLPAGDPESSVHPKSLPRTCGAGAIEGGSAGRCHGALGDGDIRSAGMVTLALPGALPGTARWIGTALYGLLLLGLLVRAGIGALRGR